jgi:hypothetical protein
MVSSLSAAQLPPLSWLLFLLKLQLESDLFLLLMSQSSLFKTIIIIVIPAGFPCVGRPYAGGSGSLARRLEGLSQGYVRYVRSPGRLPRDRESLFILHTQGKNSHLVARKALKSQTF